MIRVSNTGFSRDLLGFEEVFVSKQWRDFFPLPFLKMGATAVQARISTTTKDDRGSCWVWLTWQTVDVLSGASCMETIWQDACCSAAPSQKKKKPRQEGWIPFLSCSILNLWQGNNVWWQKLIFPAAPDSAWPQLRPPGSSYFTLPSHHEAFYIRSLDTMEEKQDGKSPWTHKQPLHISPTHNQLALKQIYSGE